MLALEEGEEVLFILQQMLCCWLLEEENNGVDGQAESNGTSSVGQVSSQVRNGGTGWQPGECNSVGGNYHRGVGTEPKCPAGLTFVRGKRRNNKEYG